MLIVDEVISVGRMYQSSGVEMRGFVCCGVEERRSKKSGSRWGWLFIYWRPSPESER